MTTKKLLVAFDPKNPRLGSGDFLVPVMDGTEPVFLGLKSKKTVKSGRMVYIGKEITVNDLFARLVDIKRRTESVEQTLRILETYIQKLQSFRISNLLTIEPNIAEGFELVKLADRPPTTDVRKLP